MKKILILITIISLSFSVLSCQEDTTAVTTEATTTTIAKTIELTESSVHMSINSVYSIEYTLNFDLDGSEAITFISDDTSVAEVSQLGKITGIAFGECDITVRYDETLETSIHVIVSSNYVITPPTKTVYKAGEAISSFGASMSIYDSDGNFVEEIDINNDMLIDFHFEQTGPQIVKFTYNDLVYGFEVYILDETQELSTFDDAVIITENIIIGEKLEIILTKGNILDFLEIVNNIYDYEEINIYALFASPEGVTKKVSAFWYQDYIERTTAITVDSNLRLEGTVNDTEFDYDLMLNYNNSGNPHFRIRFLPEEIGQYDCLVVVEVNGIQIQTFDKNFVVLDEANEDFKGIVSVDETNNRHFIFGNGESYVAVGQNVAWYTSVQRKYYDYKSWFEQMGAVGMNYARVWMAPWGFSIFWDDVYNYDERQTNMYSLDRTLDLADENDIYIQLCLLNHGMFSAEVNPMWPNDEEQWYISRYGANPYSEIIDNSVSFFTNTEIKNTFKNQLKYIVARYGYSDSIMSWELFNEVTWIETYQASYGNAWHQEMASYIKSIDPYDHLISTSLTNESFLSSEYQVYNIDEIDFVSVHRYGIYNHTLYLPEKQNTVYEIFHKPVIYDEVGYQGWGGAQQYEADPNNVTLHQALWGGALGGGAGTGMNWWWESWIDTYNVYSEYQGIAEYSTHMNLSGENYQAVSSTDQDYDSLDISNPYCGYMGYVVDNRVYLYIFDLSYTLAQQSIASKSGVTITIPELAVGNYQFKVYNTFTGEEVYSQLVNVSSADSYTLNLPAFNEDMAITLELLN